MTAPLMISGVFSRLGTFVSSFLTSKFSTSFVSGTFSSFGLLASFVTLQLGLLVDTTLGFLFWVFVGGFNEASLGDLMA